MGVVSLTDPRSPRKNMKAAGPVKINLSPARDIE
jgi:hypothetical protein